MIEEFKKIQIELEALLASRNWHDHPLQKEFAALIEAEWRKTLPPKSKRKFAWQKAEAALPNFAELKKPFEDKVKTIVDEHHAKEKVLKDRLFDIARQIEFTPDMKVSDKTQWVKWRSSWVSSYNSQGFGANKYAKGACENYAQKAIHYGFETEVRHNKEGIESYDCYVGATQLALDILEEKPEIPLREWVKSQWKRGVNPRVLCPFLPAGYEDEEGLDYFGGERVKEHSMG